MVDKIKPVSHSFGVHSFKPNDDGTYGDKTKEAVKPADNLFGATTEAIREVFKEMDKTNSTKDFGEINNLKVPQMLRDAAKIYEDRNKIYGDNYKHFGFVFKELFPKGLELKTPMDFNRIGILVQMVAKMTRYVANFNKGGHADSLDDLAVYTMMLRELDSDD